MVLICIAILLEAALRDIRMIERGLNPIIGRCFLVGPDSMELHGKRADCLLHRSDDSFLLMIFLLDVFILLRQLAHFNSQLLLLITVFPNEIFLFLILLFVEVFLVLCFKHLQLHLGHFLFKFFEILHKLCLEDLLLFHLLLQLALKLPHFFLIRIGSWGYGRPLRW